MTAKLSNDFDYIAANIDKVRKEIFKAAQRSGRKPDDIKLMAVTKTLPAQAINTAFENGITLFGENRVQEFLNKLPDLNMDGRSAHIIGHLQSNKVKYIIDKVDMIQSVDSLRLAQEIERQSEKADRIMDILIEVNIGGEESKSGISEQQLPELIDNIRGFSHIRVKGLMAIPPFCEEKEKTRPYFAKMHKLFIDNAAKKSDNINMSILSMGMSSDFDVAIEEGSTLIRVGTKIFGKRKYTGGN
ncbi:MAG TPA: YggS family pyridoxal phosphate-dependent enzyme [Ruminiclostridium sp.]|nr:YggS family pyridoxal phosphate-dependent enzyme [Ruminiclostridium sp.]